MVGLLHRPLLGLLGDAIGAVPLAPRHLVYGGLDAVGVVGARAQLAQDQPGARQGQFLAAHDAVTLACRLVHALVTVPAMNRWEKIKNL